MTSTTQSWWRPTPPIWRAGGWSLELRGDELADIRHSGQLVLRAVRAVVRDRSWNTVPATVLTTRTTDDTLTLRLQHAGLGAELASTLIVRVEADHLSIEWDAQTLRDFDTCRTGLVVLQPAADSGLPVTVRHSDGTEERTRIPIEIRPHQPVIDIHELHVGETGAVTHLRFEGDVFEMEDQRNWSDASFKTYSRPLALPYPYALSAGESVRQKITVHRESDPPERAPQHLPTTITLRAGGPIPAIGVEASTAADPAPASAASSVGRFRVVELDLRTPTWPAALHRAAADRMPLDVRLVVNDDPKPLAAVSRALADHHVVAVTPFDAGCHVSDAATVSRTRTALIAAGCPAPIRGGARSHFTELNREAHRLPDDLDGVVVTTTPLFHSLDTEQLVEAVPMQRLIALHTVGMADGRPVHVGPVSLRPRFNNVATTPEPAPTRSDLAEGYGAQFTGADDPRQSAGELAAWTIASAAALAVPGVDSLAWFETWGPRGLWDAAGNATPASAAVAALAALDGCTLLWAEHSDELVWAIGGRVDEEDVVLLANLDRSPRTVQLRLPDDDAEHEVQLAAGAWQRFVLSHPARGESARGS